MVKKCRVIFSFLPCTLLQPINEDIFLYYGNALSQSSMCNNSYYVTPISSEKQNIIKPISIILDAQAPYCASAKISIPQNLHFSSL